MKMATKCTRILLMIIIFEINQSYSSNLSLKEIQKALKEVAYSYYMRGKNIQYNVLKSDLYFPPEEATPQNINNLVCTRFVISVYRELLNITIPNYIDALLKYSKDNIGCPEVIAYANISSETNNLEMKFYNSSSNTNYTTKINPSVYDLIPFIQIGDVFTDSTHSFLIYDIIKDSKGNIKDIIFMESGYGRGRSWVNSKISETITLPNGKSFGSKTHFLFLNNYIPKDFEEGLEQGTVQLSRFPSSSTWVNINNTKTRHKEYSILRFIHNNSKGIPILKYKAINKNYPNNILNNQPIVLPDNTLDRIKYSHIYIEKTVNKINDNIVEIGDILQYKIIIRNMGKKDYGEIIVNEYISNFVEYESHYENRTDISFNFDINNKKVIWTINKLKHGEEIDIFYFVKIIRGKPGDVIESIGFVGNIPSSKVKNIIGNNLHKNQMKSIIEKKYEKLKNKYNGKKLINEIYKEAFNYDLKFDEFDLTKLVINNNLNSTSYSSIELNKTNIFYTSVLNKYWSSLTIVNYGNIEGKELYSL